MYFGQVTLSTLSFILLLRVFLVMKPRIPHLSDIFVSKACKHEENCKHALN